MNNLTLQSWLNKPGKVKQLQAYLALSIIFNCFLSSQIISLNSIKKKESKKLATEIEAKNLKTKTKITATELKVFIKDYLEKFFVSNEANIAYLQSKTKDNLFNKVKLQLKEREKMGLSSDFKSSDIFLESLDKDLAQAIVLGQESFSNNKYLARNLRINLLIDTKNLVVTGIPVFEIE